MTVVKAVKPKTPKKKKAVTPNPKWFNWEGRLYAIYWLDYFREVLGIKEGQVLVYAVGDYSDIILGEKVVKENRGSITKASKALRKNKKVKAVHIIRDEALMNWTGINFYLDRTIKSALTTDRPEKVPDWLKGNKLFKVIIDKREADEPEANKRYWYNCRFSRLLLANYAPKPTLVANFGNQHTSFSIPYDELEEWYKKGWIKEQDGFYTPPVKVETTAFKVGDIIIEGDSGALGYFQIGVVKAGESIKGNLVRKDGGFVYMGATDKVIKSADFKNWRYPEGNIPKKVLDTFAEWLEEDEPKVKKETETPSTPLDNNKRKTHRRNFVAQISAMMQAGKRIDMRVIKKLAAEQEITDIDYAYELTELAWTKHYRTLINPDNTIESNYQRVVDFYRNGQPTYSQTSSTKKIYQQFSTAAPISALAGWYCDAHEAESVFEPSAGNGLLTIYAPYEKTTVNELDKTRLENLQDQPFRNVLNQDALEPFPTYEKTQDVVLCNPPFGKLEAVDYNYGGFKINKLDHLMLAHALATMKDDGKAALIIGGWNKFDKSGRFSPFRAFFNWLYHHYKVVDIINIESKKLYAKQGTGFPLRMILIGGRKASPFGAAPTLADDPALRDVVDDFDVLLERVKQAKINSHKKEMSLDDLLKRALEMIELELTY